jgi:glucan phosphoethanolaminetransferase (alkaline phosphatase superfamily)
MTKIGDIPVGELRERFRREIPGNVETRRKESNEAFSELCKISSLIYPGGTIAVLSFIASRKEGAVPSYAIISFAFFILSLLSFALFLYLHYQLHAARSSRYSNSAHKFFFSESRLKS